MNNQRYTPEFKDESVKQVVERGYRVAEVAERIGAQRFGGKNRKSFIKQGQRRPQRAGNDAR